ncbi:unnamed protein product [Echinostoma caproni]|uniref:Myelin basic protein n=1 Tax=Echinostoma caproni TaxID=27848 RepID=A0A183AJY3_9TREM|nr:unnamed protein product [Echinostoma caproni]
MLTECGPYVTAAQSRPHERTTIQTGRPSGCIPLSSSPARRSASLARQNPHPHYLQRRGTKDGANFSGVGGPEGGSGDWPFKPDEKVTSTVVSVTDGLARVQHRSHRAAEQPDLNDTNDRTSTGGNRSGDTRKSHTMTTQSTYKESGGRKLLNFFQRGFTPRRPKSMTKMEHRKSSPKCYLVLTCGINGTKKPKKLDNGPGDSPNRKHTADAAE